MKFVPSSLTPRLDRSVGSEFHNLRQIFAPAPGQPDRSARFVVFAGAQMHKLRYAFAICICIAVTASCSNEYLKSKPFLIGEYECVGYNQNGTAVVKGTLSIDELVDDHFKGRWRIAKASDAKQEDVMYIDGIGDLIGKVQQKEGQINFSPNMSDANWIVDAAIEGERLVGSLRWSGLQVDR